MSTRNLTLKIDKDLYRSVKVLAAQRDTSISALVAEKLSELVQEDSAYERSRTRAIELLTTETDLGTRGVASWSRDELHER